MVETHAESRDAKQHGQADAGNTDASVEFIGAEEFKARLAANEPGHGYGENNGEVNAGDKKNQPKPKPPKATGFEDYHADAPLTPAEHAEERELYNKSIPFTERILTAIQRFERRRKLDSEKRDIFLTYLSYGGVTTGPNVFQGGKSKKDLEEMDKDELSAVLAQTSLTEDKDNIGKDTSVWAVDFEGVMKGYLSRRAPYNYGFETKPQVDIVTKVLTNFMNYLLHHDVCPEYAADILAARKICTIANAELWACAEAQRWLPGDFNIACSTLFGGTYGKIYNGTTNWMPEESGLKGFVGMTADIAREVVKFAIAGVASEGVYLSWYKMAIDNTIVTVEVHQGAGFEIVAIDKVDDETKAFYREQSRDYRPVGRIRARPWTNPDGPPEDLTPEEREALSSDSGKDGTSVDRSSCIEGTETVYEFFIEEVILQHLFVGMKVEATIRKLNCGIWFFDDVLSAFCSFDTYLCNELMLGWKEPRAVDRTPLTVDKVPQESVVTGKAGRESIELRAECTD